MEKEKVDADEKALRYIARAADGSMRDSLSLLDQCAAFLLMTMFSKYLVLQTLLFSAHYFVIF